MLKADKDGFLIGVPLRADDSVRLLGAIKGDTGKILAAMYGRGRTGASQTPTATPALRNPRAAALAAGATSAGGGRSPRPAALPTGAGTAAAVGRAGVARARDAAGRYVSGRSDGGAPTATVAAQRMAQVAEAATDLARTAETDRLQRKADQRRGADGRFGSGDGAGSRARELAGAIGAVGAGALGGDGERIDPLLSAAGEAAQLFGSVKDVASPVGRALAGLFGRRGGGDDERTPEVGWLRRVWRELRLARRDEAKSDRDTLAELKNVGAGGGEGGGGILGMLGMLIRGPLMAVAGVAFAAIAGWFTGGALYKWFESLNLGDRLGKAWESVTTFIRDTFEPARQLFSDLGAWVARLPGMDTARRIVGSAATGAQALAGRAVEAASGAGKRALGWVSGMFESGKAGAAAVSTGKGDFGGASYGKHQLASKTGTLQRFLAKSGYGAQFAGLTPGTPAFNAKWKALTDSDPAFSAAQQSFMQATHFDPQMAKLKAAGIDLSGRGSAVKEAVFSTATQFGGNTSLIQKALAGRDAASMSDADIISAVQDYKMANNASLFRSSSAGVQASVLKRAASEKATLLALSASEGGVASPTVPRLPQVPMGAPVVVAAAPGVDGAGMSRLNTPPAQGPERAGPTPVSQDVRDRTIAHIVTGGIGSWAADR